ncbi:K+-transporting ATPase, B subunit [Methanothermus fervidus DSM 2088]|uniref:Potassium-transporting ATPase ATP-binding subunit n=1 Tax=Methanothermus fervidus (strain ATCC 43054 / DSM 2088 / JCM 10308 / V24 S) TaxID=523846 RepID=E3GWW3_METFV|nr:potassium-transporting ATPase subunit KdpB [Methanothermus fervidus]ADP76852.1 K+-transporting ATPase, B subunit [Methanothermus fervidus DSM 2088]
MIRTVKTKLPKESLFQKELMMSALKQAIINLNPLVMIKNIVMFIVEVGAIITTFLTIHDMLLGTNFLFNLQITLWLWFTVIFANFAESLAEIQGKARSESLKKTREVLAKKLDENGKIIEIPASKLKKGDIVLVEEKDIIPMDGDIIEGKALIDESPVTGESTPVIRESGGDRCGVVGGTKVLSGKIKVKITVDPEESFVNRMIKMVESAEREKTPNEKALEVLLIGLTITFIAVVGTLPAFASYMGVATTIPVLISLLVCLMPTTIGALLPAIGIAGMNRLLKHNVIALSGRAIEAAGDVDVMLLDKTGTITHGSRKATEFIPLNNVRKSDLVWASLLASLADETPEGKSIVELAKKELNIRHDIKVPPTAKFIPFTPETRMSGVNIGNRKIRKGAIDAVKEFVLKNGGYLPEDEIDKIVKEISSRGETPILVADDHRALGIIRLEDVIKKGVKDKLSLMKKMGIKTIMITGDNPITAKAIAKKVGVDDFIANAKPETKLKIVEKYESKEERHIVAMIGDGTNDAPALAKADVAIAMSSGTSAAKEAANMVDLDSTPSKIIKVVEVGKEILITRGAMTTFSVTNDVAKYFAILPAIFSHKYPELAVLNIMGLTTPASAVLSAVIFNAIIIPLLIPLALRGVRLRPGLSPSQMLIRNILIYGVGGLIAPFVGIKLIDILLVSLGLGG